MVNFDLFEGNALTVLKDMPDKFFETCVTSPPYWRKRDYGHPEQLGQEKTPEEFVCKLSDVFDEVKRVLVDTGSLWINIDDTYLEGHLVGVPWMLAFELKRRGWCLRADAIWWKPNSSPEPTKNRLTRSHEYMFHFTKSKSNYYFDMDSVREPHTNPWALDCIAKFANNPVTRSLNFFSKQERHEKKQKGMTRAEYGSMMNARGKHKRDVLNGNRFFRLKAGLTEEQIKKVIARLSHEPDPV